MDSSPPHGPVTCRLCGSEAGSVPPAHGRRFVACPRCGLVFVHPAELPTAAEERARYDTHDNRIDDPGYRAFLEPAADAVRDRLPPGAVGLDYGAGPGPALAVMLTEAGYPTGLWDPFYHADPAALARTYDFVVCTETAEHFHRPDREFARLAGLLRGKGSHLVLMTRVLEPGVDLAGWWYARDPTHVAFYRPETLAWIARRHGWKLAREGDTLAVFSPRSTRQGALRRTEFVAWVAAGVLGAFALAGAWQGLSGRPEGWFVFGALGIFAFPALMAALVARTRRRRAEAGDALPGLSTDPASPPSTTSNPQEEK